MARSTQQGSQQDAPKDDPVDPADSATSADSAASASSANEPDEDDDPDVMEQLQTLLQELNLKPEQLAGRLRDSRKWEQRAKRDHEDAEKFRQQQKEGMSDADRLKAEKEDAEKTAREAEVELVLYKAATKHGLDEDDLDFLRKFDPEEIPEKAERLAARVKRGTGKSTSANDASRRRGDTVGSGSKVDLQAMDEAIRKAQTEGRVRDALALKRERAQMAAKENSD